MKSLTELFDITNMQEDVKEMLNVRSECILTLGRWMRGIEELADNVSRIEYSEDSVEPNSVNSFICFITFQYKSTVYRIALIATYSPNPKNCGFGWSYTDPVSGELLEDSCMAGEKDISKLIDNAYPVIHT